MRAARRDSRRTRKMKHGDPPWTPFREGRTLPELGIEFYNSRYGAWVMQTPVPTAFQIGEVTITHVLHLSFKRHDRGTVIDWREKLRIKNEICDLLWPDGNGEDCEAVELYPAMSRCVDMANQYHLWILPPGIAWPCGFQERAVEDHSTLTGAGKEDFMKAASGMPPFDFDKSVQRPVPAWMRPGVSCFRNTKA